MCNNPPSIVRASPRRPGFLASILLAIALAFGMLAPIATAKPREATIPLRDGQVVLADLSATLCRELKLPPADALPGRLDLNGLKGSNFVAAVNQSLGDGCQVSIKPDALVLRVDPDKLPQDVDAAKRAVRIFTAVETPEATAAQAARHGLRLPARLDPGRPLVVLIHGMDSSQAIWDPLQSLLGDAGHQVAHFGYASDAPIEESGDALAKHLIAFRNAHPATPVEIVAHSMGGLVARSYVEGPAYAGGVRRLILCGTPNAGSTWAKYRLAVEAQEHFRLWKNDPAWSPTWAITDGLGEAGRDLKPGSDFLKNLNARPRRDGVAYTVIAGDQSPVSSTCADWWDCSARTLMPGRVGGWWGLRHCKRKMHAKATTLRAGKSDGDGPVKLESARLPGAADFVVVHADHVSLCYGSSPAAWGAIRERVGR